MRRIQVRDTLALGLRARIFPDRWSSLFGQISFYSLVAMLLGEVFLIFFYDPSSAQVTYHGSYGPLEGVQMTRAFESTLNLSFEIPGGLLMRQLHDWASLVMMAALMMLLLRLFFTGAFRRPHEKRWLVAVGLLLAAMGAGLTGQALPDDMASGTSMAVIDGVLQATPLVGTLLSSVLFGGPFPGDVNAIFYPAHLLLTASLVPLYGALVFLAIRNGTARTAPLRAIIVKRAGAFALTLGVLVLMAATLTINPIWLYGPANPASATAGATPSWYLAFLDGALRLAPGWEVVWLGSTWSIAVLLPVLACTLFLAIVAVYPVLERWITKERRENLPLERPRDNPTRTGIGVAGMAFYGVLWAAAGSNTLARVFGVTVEGFMYALQVLLIAGPILGFILTRRISIGLQRRDREIAEHGYETGYVMRSAEGGYSEVLLPAPRTERELEPAKTPTLSARL